jgi:integrase
MFMRVCVARLSSEWLMGPLRGPQENVRPQHFVVVTKTGGALDHHSAGRRLSAIVKKAGLDVEGLLKITPHQLRYSFGSLLVDAGESTARLSRLMGHANEAITGAIYTHEIVRRDNADRTREKMRQAFASRGRTEVKAVAAEA